MGGKNTKVDSPKTEWDNHATDDQSSAMPGGVRISQISQKYENNIKALIQNLQHNPNDSTEVPLTEILKDMSLSYNTKYQIQSEEPPQNPPKINKDPKIDTFAESPFLSPVKYANLLNSHTSDNAQHGGANKSKKKPQTKKGKPQTKKEKSEETSEETSEDNYNKASKSDETTDEENNKTSDEEDENKTTDNEVTDNDEEEDNKTSDDDNVNEATSSEHTTNSASNSENIADENANDIMSDGSHGKYPDDKYEKDDSSPGSVHTSQINMLDDSY